jgi:hypothetical protein
MPGPAGRHRSVRLIVTATLAGMEGALILCRAEGGVGLLESVAAELLRLLPPETNAPTHGSRSEP